MQIFIFLPLIIVYQMRKSELNRTKFVNSGNFTYLCGVNTLLSL